MNYQGPIYKESEIFSVVSLCIKVIPYTYRGWHTLSSIVWKMLHITNIQCHLSNACHCFYDVLCTTDLQYAA